LLPSDTFLTECLIFATLSLTTAITILYIADYVQYIICVDLRHLRSKELF